MLKIKKNHQRIILIIHVILLISIKLISYFTATLELRVRTFTSPVKNVFCSGVQFKFEKQTERLYFSCIWLSSSDAWFCLNVKNKQKSLTWLLKRLLVIRLLRQNNTVQESRHTKFSLNSYCANPSVSQNFCREWCLMTNSLRWSFSDFYYGVIPCCSRVLEDCKIHSWYFCTYLCQRTCLQLCFILWVIAVVSGSQEIWVCLEVEKRGYNAQIPYQPLFINEYIALRQFCYKYIYFLIKKRSVEVRKMWCLSNSLEYSLLVFFSVNIRKCRTRK